MHRRKFPPVVICDCWRAGFLRGREPIPAAVELRTDWDAKRIRAAAREVEDADQARRLLAIAAAYGGQDRTTAAEIGAIFLERGTGAAVVMLRADTHAMALSR